MACFDKSEYFTTEKQQSKNINSARCYSLFVVVASVLLTLSVCVDNLKKSKC